MLRTISRVSSSLLIKNHLNRLIRTNNYHHNLNKNIFNTNNSAFFCSFKTKDHDYV